MDRKKYVLFYLLPLFLYATAIFASSSVSNFPTIRGVVSQEPVPKGAWTGDDIEHIVTYGILAFLFYRAILHTRYQKHVFVVTLIFCFVFGFFDEIHQSFIPERSFSIKDILWNFLGSSTVRFSAVLLRRK